MNKELIIQENIILNLYDSIYKLELSGKSKSNMFYYLVSELKKELIKERELLEKINSNYSNIADIISNNIYSNSILKEGITERIDNRIINNMSRNFNDKYFDKLSKMSKYLLYETDSIYLSFLDEFINTETDLSLKNELINTKYLKIITMNPLGEDNLIDNEFYTDKSLYLCSELISQILKIDPEELFDMKKEIMDIFLKLGFKLLPYCDDKFTLIISNLNIRTAFIVSNDSLDTKLLERNINSDDIKNNKTRELLQLINKDRERHKRVSLIKKK